MLSSDVLASTNGSNTNSDKVTNSTESTNSTTSTNNNTEDKKEATEPAVEESSQLEAPIETEVQQANDGAMFIGQKPDSTSINSVSKFNFIFYFIYKLKYDEDPNSIGHLNYEF